MIIAPAKNILFGEHAGVYPPNTIIIAANNLECKAEAKKNNTSSTLQINASGTFSLNRNYDIALLLEYLAEVRRKYNLFLESKDIALLKSVIKEDDDLLKLTIAVALDYLGGEGLIIREKGERIKDKRSWKKVEGFSLYLLSNVPSQSGFGSSAVFSSAVIAAVLDAFGVKFNKDLIFELTMEIESFQHGTPSGEGPAAVIYGGLIKLNKNETGKPKIVKLQITNPILQNYMENLMIVNSGKPLQSTGELIALVRENKNKTVVLNKIEENTQKFLKLNEKENCEESEFMELINTNGKLLEELGLITESAKIFADEIRKQGGAVKISGAGGCAERTPHPAQRGGSGALLVYHPDREVVKKLVEKYKFEFYDINFGSEGIRKV